MTTIDPSQFAAAGLTGAAVPAFTESDIISAMAAIVSESVAFITNVGITALVLIALSGVLTWLFILRRALGSGRPS